MTEHDQIGAYRLVKKIGAGGMGEVWLAEHALLGRRAAIKLLHPMFSAQPDIVTRFFNEARAATAIADLGIVQIFDFGHTDGAAYIAMEMLDGVTLEERRAAGMQIADALRVLRQVASSLGAAHACGIVHRDLKPDNIFLVRDPEVAGGERTKILDFGIAKLTATPGMTSTAAVMGTPAFMSPEQCRGAGHVDARSDVYSLGCVLFLLVTGRAPFEAEGMGELIVQHITEPAPRASSLVPVPTHVDDLIARCLDKDPAARPANGSELATELGRVIAGLDGSTTTMHVPTPTSAMVAAARPTTLSASIAVSLPAAAPRRRTRSLAIAAAVLAASATAFVVAHSSDSDGAAAPTSFAAAPDAPPPPPPAPPPPIIATPEPTKSPPPVIVTPPPPHKPSPKPPARPTPKPTPVPQDSPEPPIAAPAQPPTDADEVVIEIDENGFIRRRFRKH